MLTLLPPASLSTPATYSDVFLSWGVSAFSEQVTGGRFYQGNAKVRPSPSGDYAAGMKEAKREL